MDNKNKGRSKKSLSERMVRNDDIFCSLLFDSGSRTLRVVDFRGGNFQNKHSYLERVLMSEGMRKIFTLIERDDMTGWQRVGYQKEGTIPGYYKRSDAYIMSRVYDQDYDPDERRTEENPELLVEVKGLAKDLSDIKASGTKAEEGSVEEVIAAIRAEVDRLSDKAKALSAKKSAKGVNPLRGLGDDLDDMPPIFNQFSREVEDHYFILSNKRSKQINVVGAEYQDCFGNAKIDYYFPTPTKVEQSLVKEGLGEVMTKLTDSGVVSLFSLVRVDDPVRSAIYLASGFRNTGLLARQLLTPEGAVDQLLWTRKLI
ncbi:MAG: hypothetical protein MUC50_18575 [Myxococcota bacterium]|jgi:hypothetical protein|nr:hypothetical protein [Myxococcota bacterium]